MGTQVGGVAILEALEAAVAHGAVTQIQVGVVIMETTTGQLPPTQSIAIAVLARRLPRAGDIVADAQTTIITKCRGGCCICIILVNLSMSLLYPTKFIIDV